MNNFIRAALVVLLCLLFASTSAFADQYHYNNLLVGDRASGMGGAYTAVSDDATGLYYNPAGIAYATGRNLSASVNAYYHLTKSYSDVIGGKGWERKSSALLPNFFGIVQPIGKLKFGFSYAVPDSNKEDQDQTFHNLSLNTTLQSYNPGVNISSYTINFNNDDNTYQFGPSLAGEVARDFAAGITLYIHQRRVQRILSQFLSFSNGGSEWLSSYYELNETGVRPVLGFAWSPMEKIAFGLSLSKIILLDSQRATQFTYGLRGLNTDGSAGVDDVSPTLVADTIGTKKKYPLQTALGMAYFHSSNLLLTFDLSYHPAVAGDNNLGDPTFSERVAVLNWAAGAEYYLTRSWAMRGGLFSNYSNTPDIKAGQISVAEEHVDMYGGSLSLSHFTRNTSVTLGGNIATGSGSAQIISGSTAVQALDTTAWMIFLSSSYTF